MSVDELPPEKLEECKTVFNLYDYKKEGIISVDLVDRLCKNLGAYVPTDDIKSFKASQDDGKVNFENFAAFFAEHYLKKLDRNQLMNAFQFLDKGKTGTISAQELKHSLMVIGDKLTEKEADDLLKDYISKGVIDYKAMINDMTK